MERPRLTFALYLLQIIMILSLSLAVKYDIIPCASDEDCLDVSGLCLESLCKCNHSSICKILPKKLVNKLGSPCTSPQDCNISNSTCGGPTNICVCLNGTVGSDNGKKCLPISNGIDGSCEESVQCYTRTPHTECQQNKCVCQQHMHQINGSCFKSVALGGRCERHQECMVTEFSTCTESACSCVDRYVNTGSKCLLKANGLRSTCTEHLQCTEELGNDSECVEGFCKCKEMFQLKPAVNKCVQDILLNEICGTHDDCHQPGSGPSRLECALGKCKCKPFYVEVDHYCISSSTFRRNSWIHTFVFVLFSKFLQNI